MRYWTGHTQPQQMRTKGFGGLLMVFCFSFAWSSLGTRTPLSIGAWKRKWTILTLSFLRCVPKPCRPSHKYATPVVSPAAATLQHRITIQSAVCHSDGARSRNTRREQTITRPAHCMHEHSCGRGRYPKPTRTTVHGTRFLQGTTTLCSQESIHPHHTKSLHPRPGQLHISFISPRALFRQASGNIPFVRSFVRLSKDRAPESRVPNEKKGKVMYGPPFFDPDDHSNDTNLPEQSPIFVTVLSLKIQRNAGSH